MRDMVKDILKGGEIADDLLESGEERQKALTDRHGVDMSSDSWLSKSIRPLVLLILMVLQVVIVLLSAFGHHVDVAIVAQHGVLLTGAFGFYFNSRKVEKVAAQNARANIQLEKIKARHYQKIERKEARQDRRNARRVERKQEFED